MRSVWAVILVLGCGASETTVQAPVAEVAASAEAPDLSLLLVAGLRKAPNVVQGISGEAAFRAELPEPTRAFDNAYAQSSAPFSSLGTIVTGRYPGAIPLCNRLLAGEHKKTEAQQAWCARLPDQIHTAAGVLGVYGYRSLLVTAAFPGAEALAHGFGTHVAVDTWEAVGAVVQDWWAANEGAPRFLTVVLGDGAQTVLGQESLQRFPEHRLQWLETVTPEVARVELDADKVRADYAAGATRAGKILRGVLDTSTAGNARAAWSVVAATSGMSLDERSGFGDAPVPLLTDNILLDRTIRIPLLVYGPGQSMPAVQAPVEAIDILPTLAGLAGAVVPAGASGSSLLEQTEAGQAEAYAEFGDMIALRRGEFLLVFRCSLHNSTALDPTVTEQLKAPLASVPPGHYALYDVVKDPLQTQNLRASHPAKIAELRARMLAIRTGAAAPPAGTLTPQRLWALRMAPSDGYW